MPLTFDTETCLLAPGCQAPPLVCMSLNTGQLFHWTEAEDVAAWFLDSGGILSNHNIAFDFAVLAEQFPRLLHKIFKAYDDDRVHDTGIRQKLLDIANGCYEGYFRTNGKPEKIGYSLEDLTYRFFNVRLDKSTWRLRYGELRSIPVAQWPEGARKYALEDAAYADALWHNQEQQPDAKLLLFDQTRQTRAAFWVKLMSIWGITTDPVAVERFKNLTLNEYRELGERLIAYGLVRQGRHLKSGPRKGVFVEGARNEAAARARILAAFEAKGEECPRTGPSASHPEGQAKLDEAACIASGDQALVAYARYSSLKTVISKELPILRDGTISSIHSNFDSLKETGRTSSSKPQLHNLPRAVGVRECYAPRRGYVFADADYTTIELCTWAQVCVSVLKQSRMAEVLNAGKDPHLWMGSIIKGWSYEEIEARYKAGDPDAVDTRQFAKIPNFGFPGGLGVNSFVEYAASNGVTITAERAKQCKDQWHEAWPESHVYFQWINSLIDTPFPRIEQLFSGRWRGGVRYTEAANTFFQGLAADLAKHAGWLICKACYLDRNSILYGSRIALFIHDQFILEVPEAIGHECAQELARLMIEAAKTWLPDIHVSAKPLLARHWSKNAKPVYRDGRLIPWDVAA